MLCVVRENGTCGIREAGWIEIFSETALIRHVVRSGRSFSQVNHRAAYQKGIRSDPGLVSVLVVSIFVSWVCRRGGDRWNMEMPDIDGWQVDGGEPPGVVVFIRGFEDIGVIYCHFDLEDVLALRNATAQFIVDRLGADSDIFRLATLIAFPALSLVLLGS